MSLDLNTVPGFNALTSADGGLSSLLTSLTGAIAQSWDIQEASYGHQGSQVLFHVFKSAVNFEAAVDSIQDTGGHRKVAIVFPYQDGQTTDDLGREGEIFDFNVLIFGPNYKAQYRDFLQELDDPTPGTLIHPVRGSITVAAQSWIVTHQSAQRQAVAMRVRFIEHSFDVDYFISTTDTVPSALTAAIGFIAKIASAITTAESVEFVASNTLALVKSLLSGYQNQFTATLAQLNQTFNPSGSGSIPTLQPTVPGQNPGVFSVAGSPSSVFTGTGALVTSQSQQLTAALASEQAVDAVSALTSSLASSIASIEASENGQGSLIFYDQLLTMKQSILSLQAMLQIGLQTSKNSIVTYMTPQDMSVREVCFANGLTPDDSYDIEVLNPALLSMNLIPKGTIVQVPT